MVTAIEVDAGLVSLKLPDEKTLDEGLPTSPPRKRRRRAPATGAADDCFACQERQTACDRRRPYCSQCLEVGKDCSGYKTTLTWGVGVASRGKLRGLSLPVARPDRADSRAGKAASGSTPTHRRLSNPSSRTPKDIPRSVPISIDTRPKGLNEPGIGVIDHALPTHTSMLPPSSHEHSRSRPRKRARRHSLEPIQISNAPTPTVFAPLTAHPTMSYGNQSYSNSPIIPDISHYAPCPPIYLGGSCVDHDGMVQFGQAIGTPTDDERFLGHDTSSWPRGSISSTYSSDTEHTTDDEQFYIDPELISSVDHIIAMQQALVTEEVTKRNGRILEREVSQLVTDDVGAHTSMLFPAHQMPSLCIGNTPKLRFLIDYYDRVISPVIVAFDGPTNPYRAHILQLAAESQTLQHAIAALSASNLRIRRAQNQWEPRKRASIANCSYDQSVRKSSFAFQMMDGRHDQTTVSEPSTEELYHKSASIRGLNKQLLDPQARKDDSILATLLMLCLYHICDTGVARFQTQFAGVKKVLALRGGTSGKNSKASNWLTIMFTWFDAMTASVNDREDQLAGDETDMSIFENDDWALENLAGCDSRLFRIIAKLGRLNMLSQSKQVRPSSHAHPIKNERRSSSPTAMAFPAVPTKPLDYYSMSTPRYDGNGWAHMLADEDLPRDPLDTRAQFWTEWKAIRRALQDWQLDPATPNTTFMPAHSPTAHGDHLDLLHISESFRYSALLYTERLAFPHLPSSHPNFSNLVSQALMHISLVQTDVFLLWPLFITGTECVSLEDRRMIRLRCLDIQRDSGFFNNVTGLELLEKIWRLDDSPDGAVTGSQAAASCPRVCGHGSSDGQGFKWRMAMEKKGEEYIVV